MASSVRGVAYGLIECFHAFCSQKSFLKSKLPIFIPGES